MTMKTDDEEVIERVLELDAMIAGPRSGANSLGGIQMRDEIEILANSAPDLARRLRAVLIRISTLERELGASDAALIDMDMLMQTQFGPAEWAPDHPTGIAIEAARTRKGDHRDMTDAHTVAVPTAPLVSNNAPTSNQ